VTTLVELHFVVAAAMAVLALFCVAASIGLGRNIPLAWIAVSLANGMLQILVSAFAPDDNIEFFAIAVLAPLSFLLAAQAVAALVPSSGRLWRVILPVFGLAVAALVLRDMAAPFVLQAAAFEFACLIAMVDATLSVLRQPASRLRNILLASVFALLAVTAMRMAMLPLHFGPEASFDSFRQSIGEALFFGLASLLTPIAITLLLAKITIETVHTFRHNAEHDALTGLFNRRMIDALTTRTGCRGAVIFCDIDHFKRVNDRYGHDAGDQVIRSFATLLRETGHVAGRIGGEEFALLLPGWSAEEAAEVADAIRVGFHAAEHRALPENDRLSASFGVAAHRADEPVRKAFARADAALYAAKEAGRNRVVIHDPTDPLPEANHGERRRAA